MNKYLLIIALVLSLSSCTQIGTKNSVVKQSATSGASEKQAFNESVWPKLPDSPPLDDDIERRVSALMAKMSVAEKVGQIIQPEIRNITPADIRDYHLGSVLNGGGTTPNADKYASVADWVDLAEQFYQASMDESDGKVAIPILWGSDAVHGNNNLFGATLFPHNIGLGAANDPDLMFRIGKATASELAVTGLDWTFAPTVAVVRDIRWGRTYESYSESPEIVGAYAKMMIQGIQGDSRPGEFSPNNIIATAKHFIGDGGTTNGVDRGDAAISEQQLFEIHGAGFISALESNVLAIMASFNSWNGEKLHGHEYLLSDVLKGRLGFKGFVVGDWNGHQQIPGCTVDHCAAAVNAGVDMLMVPEDWREMYKNTMQDVENGEITVSRLDDAVRRILRVKFMAGLFEAGPVNQRPQVNKQGSVGGAEHRALAREAVRKSLVLLKNNEKVLPLNPSSKVLISGSAADNIAQQAGGWTLSWQGTGNTNSDFPGASSIFSGIQKVVNDAGGQVVLREDGVLKEGDFAGSNRPDVAIVVIGEQPYAEWHGDLANIEYQYGSKADLALLDKLKSMGVPVVTVFISGRPLWANKELNRSDAFVAAWLPGSEGGGVADVLFSDANGKVQYDFQGRLSFSWPKRASQPKLNSEQQSYDPLFEYGYGLSYAKEHGSVAQLDESRARQSKDVLGELWVFVSRANAPWEIQLRSDGLSNITVTGNSASLGDGVVELSSVDKVAQEDSRRVKWLGSQAASMALSTFAPLNLDDFVQEGGALEFDIIVNSVPDGKFKLGMNCDSACSNKVSLAEFAGSEKAQEWSTVSVDLGCFITEAESLAAVRDVFELHSSAQADAAIANIKVVAKPKKVDVTRYNCG